MPSYMTEYPELQVQKDCLQRRIRKFLDFTKVANSKLETASWTK